MSRRKKLSIDQLDPVLVPELIRGTAPPAIDWATMFGNAHPVEVEIGFGKGLFLHTASGRNPERNYFGVEIVRKYQLVAATRLIQAGRTNVRVACADGKIVLNEQILAGTVDDAHVYFPDPWWKKRHKKRTLFTPDFAESLARILKPGGILHIATDVLEYFALMQATLAVLPAFDPMPPWLEKEPEHTLDYLTHFERKFRMEGRPIGRATYRRTTSPWESPEGAKVIEMPDDPDID